MALHWQWNEKVGEAVVFNKLSNKEFTYNLYKGNAFLIFIKEWEEDGTEKYNVYSFFVDEEHAKRMLGLDKKDKECYNTFDTGYCKLQKVRINSKMYGLSNTKKLVNMLIKAFDQIEIEIFAEDVKEDK